MTGSPLLAMAGVALPLGLLCGSPEPARPSPQPAGLTPSAGSAPIRFVGTLAGTPDTRGKPAQPGAALRPTRPLGIAVDGAGRVFVADPGQRGVLVYDQKAGKTARWAGNAAFALSGPVAAVHDGRGRLFVADGYRPQVVVFGESGDPVAAFGSDVLRRPHGMALDPERGRLYVADTKLNQVLVFDASTFRMMQTIGAPPAAGAPRREPFSTPSHVAVNSRGNLYVTDMWTCRVQVFGPDGASLQRFVTRCQGGAEYDRAHAIAIDRQDRVYLFDPNDGSVEVFQPDGKPLEFVAGLKGPAGQAFVRTGIAIDAEDRIYVAEQREGEGRVQVFTRTRGRR